MKKLIALLMALVMCLSLCACGIGTKNDKEAIKNELNGVYLTAWTYDHYASDVGQHCHMTYVFGNDYIHSYWVNDEAPDKNSKRSGTYQIKGKEIILQYDDGGAHSLAYSYQDGVLGLSDGFDPLTKSWMIDENGTLVISHMTNNEIPDYSFSVPAAWHPYRMQIKAIKLEEGITRIGKLAFLSCEKAVSIELPASLCEIGDNAFSGCKALESIVQKD